jgi:recombinational DNA repair ATPase RecF
LLKLDQELAPLGLAISQGRLDLVPTLESRVREAAQKHRLTPDQITLKLWELARERGHGQNLVSN